MIKTERTKLFEGNIDVPEMYVMQAARAQDGLEITYKGKVMTLSFSELEGKCVRRQYYAPKEKDSAGKRKQGYYLYVYKWKPQ